MHLYLDPHRGVGRMAFVPLLWTRYPATGKPIKGWGILGQAFRLLTLKTRYELI